MKKIAVGNLGEFWYGDYKEPFEQLEGAVPGHPVGVLLRPVEDPDKLLCAMCGKSWANLGSHVSWTHKMTGRDYKEWAGLLQKSALVSESVRQAHIRSGLRNVTSGVMARALAAAPAQSARKRHRGQANSKWTPEALNKTGRCRAQVLAVGRAVSRETGRLSERDLRKRGIYPRTIATYFGDMDGYRKAVGLAPVGFRRYTATELTDALRNLAQTLGRTPVGSDLRRYGLPSAHAFRRHFGTLTEACRRAGLEPNLPVPDGRDLDLSILTTYATFGSLTRTARHLHIDRARAEATFARYGAPFAVAGFGGNNASRRKWAAEMARRLAGTAESVAA